MGLKKLSLPAVGTLAILALVFIGTQSAQAASPTPAPRATSALATSTTAQPTPAKPACWVEMNTGRSACAASQADLAGVVKSLYGVYFQSAPSASPRINALTAASQAAPQSVASPAATYIWGITYADKNYGGYSWTSTTSIVNPCSHGYTSDYINFYFGQIMNDNVESEETVGACKINLYVDNDGAGSATGWITSKGDIGPLRNTISSWRFRG